MLCPSLAAFDEELAVGRRLLRALTKCIAFPSEPHHSLRGLFQGRRDELPLCVSFICFFFHSCMCANISQFGDAHGNTGTCKRCLKTASVRDAGTFNAPIAIRSRAHAKLVDTGR